jgi:hypothetical protein
VSCLPSSSPSIHYSSLSIFRARAMCVLGIGVELPSAHCASRLATCAPLPPPSAEAYNCGALTSCLYGQRGQCC